MPAYAFIFHSSFFSWYVYFVVLLLPFPPSPNRNPNQDKMVMVTLLLVASSHGSLEAPFPLNTPYIRYA
jgi:hypothetical protein